MTDTKQILIFYFSGTGNTWWVSARIAEKLRELGLDAQAYSIEQITDEESAELVKSADIIGLGFPIYGSDAPRNFHQFLDRLPALPEGKPVFGYITQLVWSGDGCNFLEKKLREKGYILTWAIEFKMPNNIALGFSPLKYTADYAKFEPLLTRNEERIAAFCEKIAGIKDLSTHHWLVESPSAVMFRNFTHACLPGKKRIINKF
jgi:flavodoxin